MSLINTVRATVLSIANKNNFGYITPNDFNLYAKQAQLDIFEDYFYQYNSQIVKQNARVSGEGYADLVKGIVEVIDSFSSTKGLINTGINLFDLPEDYYLIDKINYYPNVTATGTITFGSIGNTLIDAAANFLGLVGGSIPVKPGMLITNTTGGGVFSGGSAFVVSVDSNTQLTISSNDFLSGIFGGTSYSIVTTKGITEVERVSQNKIFYLNSSPLTSPGLTFPAYVLGGANNINLGNTVTVYPETITTAGTLVSQYIRYPKDPNWTYLNIITGGDPSFDETAADYQDLELPLSDEPNIVNKILQYAGMSIREASLVQFGKAEENEATQQEG
jgi:hypothetical protein|tara:strand:+ start:688 stop:1686 length:999 start_codon:yes stop_codon:yes gene_type:complete